jgi:hypothetical protein
MDSLYGLSIEVVLICAAVAFVIALIVMLVMKSAHKTSKPQRAAANYIISGSFKLTDKNDIFLYQRVTKVAKPQQQSRPSGGRRR